MIATIKNHHRLPQRYVLQALALVIVSLSSFQHSPFPYGSWEGTEGHEPPHYAYLDRKQS
ncbi:hypothetical protein Hanom_Chr15g01366201 [Helianthus anomalus]